MGMAFERFTLQSIAEPKNASEYLRRLALHCQPQVMGIKDSLYEKQERKLRRASLAKLQRQCRHPGSMATVPDQNAAVTSVITGHITDLFKMLRETGGERPGAEDLLRQEHARWELLEKRSELLRPTDLENYEAAVRFMAGRGEPEDLDLLREHRLNPPFASPSVVSLIARADEYLCERLYSPERVALEGEQAYKQNMETWNQLFSGQYIAIHRGRIEDADPDKRELTRRLAERQREWGPFRAYIVHVGARILVVDNLPGNERRRILYILDEATGRRVFPNDHTIEGDHKGEASTA